MTGNTPPIPHRPPGLDPGSVSARNANQIPDQVRDDGKRVTHLVLPLLALALMAARFPDHERYDACVAQVRQNPAAAFSTGLDWLDQGGGVAAQHCAGLALSAMDKHEAAGDMLLEAANAAADGKGVQLLGMEITPKLRAQLYAQAGHSYLLAERYAPAIDAFTQALGHSPGAGTSPEAADLMTDRARAHAFSGNLEAAFTDLTVAIGILPDDADIRLLRASAARQTERLETAHQDVNKLLELRPDLPAAWLEKAQLAMTEDDVALARQSLMRAIELDDGGPVAEAARYMLEGLSL